MYTLLCHKAAGEYFIVRNNGGSLLLSPPSGSVPLPLLQLQRIVLIVVVKRHHSSHFSILSNGMQNINIKMFSTFLLLKRGNSKHNFSSHFLRFKIVM